MSKVYRKKTRDIRQGKDGKYRLWVLMDTRKLGLIDNSKLHHVNNPQFSSSIWVLAEVSRSKPQILKANNSYSYKEEWKER